MISDVCLSVAFSSMWGLIRWWRMEWALCRFECVVGLGPTCINGVL